MSKFSTISKVEFKWEFVSLGEVLLRFDPGETTIRNADEFKVYDGGAEYNVAKNLSYSFGRKTAIMTVIKNDQIGELLLRKISEGGVATDFVTLVDSEESRNGMYFIERGKGLRAPDSVFDRKYTEISAINVDSLDWVSIFEKGVRWFHTGGVLTGLSETTPNAAFEAMQTASKHGAILSYDLNYRDSLWKNRGGKKAADKCNRRFLPLVDVLIGLPGYNPGYDDFDKTEFKTAAKELINLHPNIEIIAITLRKVFSANIHSFCSAVYSNGEVYISKKYEKFEVLDRVGSGDAFTAGFFDALLEGRNLKKAIENGSAAAVLATTTFGDNLLSKSYEIEKLAEGGGSDVIR
ncbi:MAG: PfkB family carbohydrate kinase [Pyrinomonadaceae bacterium]